MSAYSTLILAESSLVSYWQLGDLTGSTATDSQDSNPGSINLSNITLNQTGNGTIGPSMFSNGSGHTIDVADATNLNSITNLTIEIWVNVSSSQATTAGQFFTKFPNGGGYPGWGLGYSIVGTNQHLFLYPGSGPWIDSGVLLSFSTWYHVVGTIDSSGNAKIYVNGALVSSTTVAINLANIGAALGIGYWSAGGGQQLAGNLMHAAIYNTVLSGSDILTHYDTGAGISGGGPIADPFYIPGPIQIGF
jgi:hypothetical protein